MAKQNPLHNEKPFRSKSLRERAKASAQKNRDGFFTSGVPIRVHKEICDAHRCVCNRFISEKEEE